jgi:hypothetical protein
MTVALHSHADRLRYAVGLQPMHIVRVGPLVMQMKTRTLKMLRNLAGTDSSNFFRDLFNGNRRDWEKYQSGHHCPLAIAAKPTHLERQHQTSLHGSYLDRI